MKVRCPLCSRTHKNMGGGDENQGVDCATSLTQNAGQYYLVACYGSSYDGDCFKFLKEPFGGYWPKELSICDPCIKEFLDKKIIELIGEDFVWGIAFDESGKPFPRGF